MTRGRGRTNDRAPVGHRRASLPAMTLLTLGLVLGLVLIGGCEQPKLVPTPNLYLGAAANPFEEVPEVFRSNQVEMFYVTDRAPEPRDDGTVRYGYERSHSVAFGSCTVSIGNDVPWDTLVAESVTARRKTPLPLRVTEIEEIVRAPSSSTPPIRVDGRPVDPPELIEGRAETGRIVSEHLNEALSRTPCKEVFLYVHGFNNDFDEAAFRLAQLWHFMGRVGVPIVYTWPAGHPGLLRGYTYDRESGEFTVFHLRSAIQFLAKCPTVEKINILAHSRGTDVATSALRELHIEYRGQGLDTRTELKLGRVILAAPDLDFEVVGQRIAADRLHLVPEQFTIYLSEDDRAIRLSSWLFASARRLGQATLGDFTPAAQESLAEFPEIDLVDVDVDDGFLGHGYFISNPAVLSDLILVYRDGRLPGAEHGRPMTREGSGFWKLTDSYLKPKR